MPEGLRSAPAGLSENSAGGPACSPGRPLKKSSDARRANNRRAQAYSGSTPERGDLAQRAPACSAGRDQSFFSATCQRAPFCPSGGRATLPESRLTRRRRTAPWNSPRRAVPQALDPRKRALEDPRGRRWPPPAGKGKKPPALSSRSRQRCETPRRTALRKRW